MLAKWEKWHEVKKNKKKIKKGLFGEALILTTSHLGFGN